MKIKIGFITMNRDEYLKYISDRLNVGITIALILGLGRIVFLLIEANK